MAKLKPSNNPNSVSTAVGTPPTSLALSGFARLRERPTRHPNSARASSATVKIANTSQLEKIRVRN
jgi:hypothetical protein